MPIALINEDNRIRITNLDLSSQIDHIPPRIYSIGMDDNGPFLQKEEEKFNLPEKIYGEFKSRRDLIIRTFRNRKESTGALLTGTKGMGKTLLVEMICNQLLQEGLPVLRVTNNTPPAIINLAIKSMGPCVVYMDEFAKTFPEKDGARWDQSDLVTLFSDSTIQQTLFLLTENDLSDISEYMLGRPGRILFHMSYNHIDASVADALLDEYKISNNAFRRALKRYVVIGKNSFDVAHMAMEIASQYQPDQFAQFVRDVEMYNIPHIRNVSVQIKVPGSTECKCLSTGEFIGYTEFALSPAGQHAGSFNGISADESSGHFVFISRVQNVLVYETTGDTIEMLLIGSDGSTNRQSIPYSDDLEAMIMERGFYVLEWCGVNINITLEEVPFFQAENTTTVSIEEFERDYLPKIRFAYNEEKSESDEPSDESSNGAEVTVDLPRGRTPGLHIEEASVVGTDGQMWPGFSRISRAVSEVDEVGFKFGGKNN